MICVSVVGSSYWEERIAGVVETRHFRTLVVDVLEGREGRG